MIPRVRPDQRLQADRSIVRPFRAVPEQVRGGIAEVVAVLVDVAAYPIGLPNGKKEFAAMTIMDEEWLGVVG
jgi:hypothetical protein